MKNYLPIGTVVKLNNGQKNVMIIGYLPQANGKVIKNNQEIKEYKEYDYSGVVFPVGLIDSNYILMFDNENIEETINLGYEDESSKELISLLNERKTGDK